MARVSEVATETNLQVFRYKVVLVGPQGVGKTSLIRSFIEKKYEENYLPSIGTSVMVKDLEMQLPGQAPARVSLNIWDIASHDLFTTMRSTFYGGTQAAFLVTDLSRPESFEEILKWNTELRNFTPEIATMLLANKSDLVAAIPAAYREIGRKVGAFKVLTTSAKSGANVDNAFQMIAAELVKRTICKARR